MKEKITDEIRDIFAQSKNWLNLEVEYARLTIAEKGAILVSTMVIGAVCMLLGVAALSMFAFSLVEIFKFFLAPWLAFLCVGVLILIIVALIWVFRRALVLDPVCRLVTRLILDK